MCLGGLFLPAERLSCSSRLSVGATLDGRHLPVANHLAGTPVQLCQRRHRVERNSAADDGETSCISRFSPSSFLMRNSPTCTVSESLSAAGLVAAPSATSSSVVFTGAGSDSRVVLWLGTPVEWCVERPGEKVGKTREEE